MAEDPSQLLSGRTILADSPSKKTARKVLEIESKAISGLANRLDDKFDQAVDLLASCRGRAVTTGLGKSGIIARKLSATLASTGTPSLFLHPVEAIHGDLGMVVAGDVVLMLSNSGETDELLELASLVTRRDVPVIALVGSMRSRLALVADCTLDCGIDQEACPFGLAPTASTTACLAMGDALALALSEHKGFKLEDFARLHPGGMLGKKLARVSDLMHTGDRVPRVSFEVGMQEVIYEISRKGFGITSVVDSGGHLIGVISDGDLRRLLQERPEEAMQLRATDAMTSNPITIPQGELAGSALNIMESRKITSLMVTTDHGDFVGILHLHDLWGTELF